MAIITLSNTFTVVPEGSHIFKITKVTYNQQFGKLEFELKTKEGCTHRERFSLMNADKSANAGAVNAFSFFAKTALNDFGITEIDPNTLVGRFIGAEVKHTIQPNRNDPTKTVTFANLGEKWVATGFEEDTPTTTTPKEENGSTAKIDGSTKAFDLNKLLGK